MLGARFLSIVAIAAWIGRRYGLSGGLRLLTIAAGVALMFAEMPPV